MLEKQRHTVSSLRGEPLPAALNGPLPCRPPPDPLQSCLFLPSGPERNRNVSLSAASMVRPSARRLCRNLQNRPNVILNEVKNLMYSIHCTTQIPRLRLGMTLRHSLSEERKAGAMRQPAHRDATVSKSRDIAGWPRR